MNDVKGSFEQSRNFWKTLSEPKQTPLGTTGASNKEKEKESARDRTSRVVHKVIAQFEQLSPSAEIQEQEESKGKEKVYSKEPEKEKEEVSQSQVGKLRNLFESQVNPAAVQTSNRSQSQRVSISPHFLKEQTNTDKEKLNLQLRILSNVRDDKVFNDKLGQLIEKLKNMSISDNSQENIAIIENAYKRMCQILESRSEDPKFELEQHLYSKIGDIQLQISDLKQTTEEAKDLSSLSSSEVREARLSGKEEIVKLWENELENLLQYDESQLKEKGFDIINNLELFEKRMEKELKFLPDIKSNLAKRLSEEISQLRNKYNESKVLDLKSIKDDLEILSKIKVTEVTKKTTRDLNGNKRSYTLYPDGRIYVHLKKAEYAFLGGKIRRAVLGIGGVKKAKLMQNTEDEKFLVRAILKKQMATTTKNNVIQFLNEMKGEKYIFQMDYQTWKSRPRKDIFGKLKKSIEKEAFIADYYPYVGGDPQIPEKLNMQIALQISRGLKTIHDKGWVHRDLKPTNLFINWDPANPDQVEAVIADPDCVHRVTDEARNEVVGTPGYIAPEYFPPNGVSDAKPVDIFALGATLLELYTKKRAPWTEGVQTTVRYMNVMGGGAYLQTLEGMNKNPNDLERLILDMLKYNPEERPKIDEVIARLEALQSAAA